MVNKTYQIHDSCQACNITNLFFKYYFKNKKILSLKLQVFESNPKWINKWTTDTDESEMSPVHQRSFFVCSTRCLEC